ncbi:MAG: hypothetical protein ACK5MY_11325 [Jhaorihella sp.]
MSVHARSRFWTRWRLTGAVLAASVVGIFAAANAHLVAVSVASQPGCVAHVKAPTGGGGVYRAAKPSC